MSSTQKKSPELTGSVETGREVRRAAKRLAVVRLTSGVLRFTGIPGLAVLAGLFLHRTVEAGALYDIRTAGTMGALAAAFGMLRWKRHRLAEEAADLERVIAPGREP